VPAEIITVLEPDPGDGSPESEKTAVNLAGREPAESKIANLNPPEMVTFSATIAVPPRAREMDAPERFLK
jgi:hypothetical protein